VKIPFSHRLGEDGLAFDSDIDEQTAVWIFQKP